MEEDKISNCLWGYQCSQTWGSLKKTLNPNIRFCFQCRKDVFKTASENELIENVKLNRCIYFSKSLLISDDDKKESTMLLGRPYFPSDFDDQVIKNENTPNEIFGKDIIFESEIGFNI